MEEENNIEVICEICENKLLHQDMTYCFLCTNGVCDTCSLAVYIWRCDEDDEDHSCWQCKVRIVCKNHPNYKKT